jgi:hypothetical protein
MTDWKAIAIHWHQESCACSDPVGHMEGEAEMEKVEAGGRALETARNKAFTITWNSLSAKYTVSIPCYDGGEVIRLEDVAALIQSAMNAQERELREALREGKRLVGMLSSFVMCGENMDAESAGIIRKFYAEAERLLAERGEGR